MEIGLVASVAYQFALCTDLLMRLHRNIRRNCLEIRPTHQQLDSIA